MLRITRDVQIGSPSLTQKNRSGFAGIYWTDSTVNARRCSLDSLLSSRLIGEGSVVLFARGISRCKRSDAIRLVKLDKEFPFFFSPFTRKQEGEKKTTRVCEIKTNARVMHPISKCRLLHARACNKSNVTPLQACAVGHVAKIIYADYARLRKIPPVIKARESSRIDNSHFRSRALSRESRISTAYFVLRSSFSYFHFFFIYFLDDIFTPFKNIFIYY